MTNDNENYWHLKATVAGVEKDYFVKADKIVATRVKVKPLSELLENPLERFIR